MSFDPHAWLQRLFPPYHVTVVIKYVPSTDTYLITGTVETRLWRYRLQTPLDVENHSQAYQTLAEAVGEYNLAQLKRQATRSPTFAPASSMFAITAEQFVQLITL